jgi:hypothetical protein
MVGRLRGLMTGGGHRGTSAARLCKAIEREFLYRGVSTLVIDAVQLAEHGQTATIEFSARPLYGGDVRLQHKSWAQVYVEQVLQDAVRVVRVAWIEAPALASIVVRVARRSHGAHEGPEGTILMLRASGTTTKQAVLRWGKTAPAAILAHAELRYDFDAQWGLGVLRDGERATVACTSGVSDAADTGREYARPCAEMVAAGREA